LQKTLHPVFPGGIEKDLGAQDIRPDEHTWPHMQTSIHMALSGEIHHRIDTLPAKYTGDIPDGCNIAMDKGMPGVILEIGQILDVTRISESIKIDHFILGMIPKNQTCEITTNEASSAGNKNSHALSFSKLSVYR
jgi:hypothetical protein